LYVYGVCVISRCMRESYRPIRGCNAELTRLSVTKITNDITTSNLSSPDSFFFKLKMHQNPFLAGCPGPRWGAYDAPLGRAYDVPPDPLVHWGGGYLWGNTHSPPPQRLRHLKLHCGASLLRPPKHKFLAMPMDG